MITPRRSETIIPVPTAPQPPVTVPLDPSVGELAAELESLMRALSRHAACGNASAVRVLDLFARDARARTVEAGRMVLRNDVPPARLAAVLGVSTRAVRRRFRE